MTVQQQNGNGDSLKQYSSVENTKVFFSDRQSRRNNFETIYRHNYTLYIKPKTYQASRWPEFDRKTPPGVQRGIYVLNC